MVYKCLIADDNILDLDVLQLYLSKIDSLNIVAVCNTGLEAAKQLANNEIDIVFSDVDMPDLSGIELLQSLKYPPVFVFISSYAEYAVESFNLDVIDFISKPVTLPRLLKAANKAIDYIELKKNMALDKVANPTPITTPVSPLNTADFFYIKENNDYLKLQNADVLFVESMGNFSRLYTVQQTKHITLVSLKNIEQQLPQSAFLRVHKQYIVNLNHIVSISASGDILLTGEQIIPLSNQYKTTLMEVVNNKMLKR